MNRLESQLSDVLFQRRWLLFVIALILELAAVAGAKQLIFNDNYRQFFGPDNPQLLAFDETERTYTKNDNVLLVIAPQEGDIFTQKALKIVKKYTERAWQTPYSTRVDSLTNFQHTHADQDDLIVRDLVPDTGQLSAADLKKIRTIALSEPRLLNRLVAENGKTTAINITVQLPPTAAQSAQPEIVRFVRQMALAISAEDPNLEVHLTGVVMLNNAFNEAALADAKSLVPISFAAMFIMLAILLGSIWSTLAVLLIVFLSIAGAMGLGGHMGLTLNNTTTNAPIVILTVAVANCVHIAVSYVQALQAKENKLEAIAESLRINVQPVALASITTSIGFLTLTFSEVPPFREMGLFVAIGVLLSMIFTFGILPALLSVLPVRVKPHARDEAHFMSRFANFVIAKRRLLFFTMLGVLLISISGLPRNQLNDVFAYWFDPAIEFRADTDFITENLTGLYAIEYSLKSAESGGVGNPEFLRDVAQFAEWYRDQPEVMHVSSISDVMARLNKNMHSDDPAHFRLPESRELSAQYLLLYEMSLPYGLDLNNELNVDKSATRFIVTIKTLSTNEILDLSARADQWLSQNAENIVEGIGTGPIIMFSHIGARNIVAMLLAATLALVLISLLLIVALRSLKIGLLTLVPNLAPAAVGFGLWGYFNGEVGLGLSIVASMTLGIVVDDTVHFLSKYLRARRERGLEAAQAVRYAFRTVGTALVFTSLALVTGFFILSGSLFRLTADMGLLTGIVILLAILADFLFLPPLLMKLEENQNAKMAIADPAADVR